MHNSEKSTISAFLRKSDIQFDNYKGKVLKNITEQEQ